ncbi:hypothetical protein Fmac_000798 [Flemingia macrophylla]|uniref:Fe2OG dioxygenase domain-containing protein n=1 Tax=Flemingia macrophylla TaxID=520843 RepID=A0ABD1NF96_9FABA
MIPCFDFCKGGVSLKEGSEEWKEMTRKVIEALESHGCFLLTYDKIIPKGVRGEMFNDKNNTIVPLTEAFGLDEVPSSDAAQTFTNLMWPQGNQPFSEAVKGMSLKMIELNCLIQKMIVEGYGLPQRYISDVENMNSTSFVRLVKYEVPETKSAPIVNPHTDRSSSLTILCDNGVQGLQVLSKDGKWIELQIPQHGFVVIVGDILKAWSNGRLRAAPHRVMVSGDTERYSFVLFAMPKGEMVIEVPYELVDNEIHPLRYRSFNCGEYFNYYYENPIENTLEIFAGL